MSYYANGQESFNGVVREDDESMQRTRRPVSYNPVHGFAPVGPSGPPPNHFLWPSQQQGLGLVQMPPASLEYAHDGSMSMPVATDVAFVPQRHNNMVPNMPIDSWNESCDPMSTILPNSFWDPMQPFRAFETTQFDSSTFHSYNTDDRQLLASSQYVAPQNDARESNDPVVKLEEPQTPRPQPLNDASPFEKPLDPDENEIIDEKRSFSIDSTRENSLSECSSISSGYSDAKPARNNPSSNSHAASWTEEAYSDEERHKRGFTKPENASCQCDQCGKLFQRSYNLKAHLETHDPNRPQPNPCQYPGCNKRFVRRTDLVRHEQSVHLKMRNFICPLCNSSFARKDTLRRHVDDGCPRRPEVRKRFGRTPQSSNASRSRHRREST
ncbi:hypothetical protein D0865_14315 [Hortaea werneckii]|uniref:C2H2-type domain-containing protein n=1 Tax=Hortaea werneckii TaxID=91943 RepID=A0A3M7B2J6_HORWE|nr:hypothetical protein D0865_14315 [Hortaea werneckii]